MAALHEDTVTNSYVKLLSSGNNVVVGACKYYGVWYLNAKSESIFHREVSFFSLICRRSCRSMVTPTGVRCNVDFKLLRARHLNPSSPLSQPKFDLQSWTFDLLKGSGVGGIES
jgi:hypothetical protein